MNLNNQVRVIHTNKYYKELNFHCRYLGTSAADASLGPNNVYVMMWSTNSTGTSYFSSILFKIEFHR